MEKQLLIPILVYSLYILLFFFYVFKTRANSVKNKTTDVHYFKTYSSGQADERSILVGRHLDNQFQVPLFFFMLVVATLSLGLADIVLVMNTWFFVLTRFLHAYIHLGTNKVLHRAKAFGLGILSFLFMILYLCFKLI